jgi:hypothetical protein
MENHCLHVQHCPAAAHARTTDLTSEAANLWEELSLLGVTVALKPDGVTARVSAKLPPAWLRRCVTIRPRSSRCYGKKCGGFGAVRSRLGIPLRLSPAIVLHRHRGLPRACLPRITLRPTAGAAQRAPPVPRRVSTPLRATLRSVAHAASAPCATVPSRWRFSAPCWRRRASGTALRPLPAPCKAGRSGIARRNGARHSQRPAQSATARRRARGVHCAESWSPPAKAPPAAIRHVNPGTLAASLLNRIYLGCTACCGGIVCIVGAVTLFKSISATNGTSFFLHVVVGFVCVAKSFCCCFS